MAASIFLTAASSSAVVFQFTRTVIDHPSYGPQIRQRMKITRMPILAINSVSQACRKDQHYKCDYFLFFILV